MSLACAILTQSAGSAQATVSYDSKVIGKLLVDNNRGCVFFQLNGVAEADPIVPGQAWFAIPKANVNYNELLSFTLTAKASEKLIFVQTDGTLSCGLATAVLVGLD
jgi:hypothetical protein